MKIKPSIVLSVILFCVIAYGLFSFAGNLLGINGNDNSFIKVSGRIEGTEYHDAAKIAGKVKDFSIEEGQEVQAGEQIATIDSPQLNAMVDQAEAYLRKAESNLNLAEMEFTRYSQLLKQNAIQKQLYDEVESRYLAAKEDALAAKKELQKLTADLADAKITSPISGKIVTKIVQSGEVIGVGIPLVTIIDMNNLFLKAFLPTENIGKISVGDEAKIFPDAFSKESFDAFVNKISEKAEFTPKNVETKSQRANLVFEIKLKVKENRGYRLKPGMPAEAMIRVDKGVAWKTQN
ncbi:MAG: efflux RND transporter periplasmic adaptor subunit [Candidatus Saganbacteria bacterium]|nr:efflux RND transporter periplasmic adaptor subunit [Candidatus Saganbacteria bacterium]